MTRVSFYLAADATTPGQLDAQLLPLLNKLWAMEQRVVVRCPDANRVARLSELLWKTPPESFLPHSTDADALPPEKQPIFLTAKGGNPSGAKTVVRLIGSSEDTDTFTEVIEFFSGLETDREIARKRWRVIQKSKDLCRFFTKENGRWALQ